MVKEEEEDEEHRELSLCGLDLGFFERDPAVARRLRDWWSACRDLWRCRRRCDVKTKIG